MSEFTCTKTRECRANNPFGMSAGPFYDNVNTALSVPNQKTGKYYAGIDDELGDMLVIFKAFQDGLNAALWRLCVVYFKQGINTPRTIYNKWSGDTEQAAEIRDELSNGAKVAEIMGVSPDIILNFTLDSLLPLLQAMLRFEDTTEVFKSDLVNIPIEMWQNAIDYAQNKAV